MSLRKIDVQYVGNCLRLPRLERNVAAIETEDGRVYKPVETCVCDGTIQWQWTGPTTYFEHELSCGHVITSTEKEPPNFCEECGRRIER